MSERKRLIQKEYDYLDYLHAQITNQVNQTHFLNAVQWRWKQSESYRRKFYFLQWLQALLGISVIVLGAFQEGVLGIAITIIGGVSTLVTFALSLHKYFESWKRYRNSLEHIKSLTRIYISKNEPFNSTEQQVNDKRYILELDKIICDETHGWSDMRNKTLSDKNI